jgi:hypothetical protein
VSTEELIVVAIAGFAASLVDGAPRLDGRHHARVEAGNDSERC